MATSGQSTFGELLDELAALTGFGGKATDDSRTTLKWCLNRSAADVWNAFLWPERIKHSFIVTAGQYTTGTITVLNGSTAIVGAGTTFTASMVGRRLALTSSSVWYRVASFTDTTHINLERVYTETSGAAKAYTIYADEYDVDESVESIQNVGLLSSTGSVVMLDELDLERWAAIPQSLGSPRIWAAVTALDVSPNTRRVRLWPVPSSVLTLEVRGATFWEDMVDEDETPKFHRDKERVVVLGALLQAQRITGGPALTTYPEIQVMVQSLWAKTKPVRPWTGRRKTFDRVRYPGYYFPGPALEA